MIMFLLNNRGRIIQPLPSPFLYAILLKYTRSLTAWVCVLPEQLLPGLNTSLHARARPQNRVLPGLVTQEGSVLGWL